MRSLTLILFCLALWVGFFMDCTLAATGNDHTAKPG